MNYSIIIPVLNEAPKILDCLQNIRTCIPNGEIIVVDGGSTDGTQVLLEKENVRLLKSSASRGGQCHEGAQAARGDVLIFLHADSILKRHTGFLLDQYFANKELNVATFSILFDGSERKYRFFELGARVESMLTTYGDQGIIVRRDFYENQVSIPDVKLFEDVEFFRRVRKLTKIVKLKIPITTSVRRYQRKGFWRMNALNACLMAAYVCGVEKDALHDLYY